MAYLIGGYIAIVLISSFVKKIKAYDAFVKGIKEGLTTVINMFSPMLGFVLIVEAIKGCGVLDDLGQIMSTNLFIQVLIRPFSASSSMAIMLDIFKNNGVDSGAAILSTFYHTSLDTSLYIVALYFTSNEIKDHRYTVFLVILITVIVYIFIYLFYRVFF